MARMYVFGDEAGDFNFSRGRGASRYFILTTVTLTDCSVGNALLDLRRALAWDGHDLLQGFHATEERQAVRDRVFAVLQRHDLRIDATIFEKAKVYPEAREESRFYALIWYLHLRRLIPRIAVPSDELLVIAASVATKRRRAVFHAALHEALLRVQPGPTSRTQFWPAAIEPCLQAADYCCWALQRKWERDDERSYALIRDRVMSEHDALWGTHTTYD